LRVTTTDTFMTTILPPHLASFRAKHPRITIELALTNTRLNLTKRDADIAVRPAKIPPAPLIGRLISEVSFAVYGADSYLDDHRSGDLCDHVWLAGDELLANSPVASWMHEHVPDAHVAFRADSFVALTSAAKAGLGLAVLPCCLADPIPTLKRLHGPMDGPATRLWLLTHRDLSDAARVRAFMDHMEGALAADRDLLEGRSVPS
ncbi:MAG: LysR substrate-binding domain-containing protein, partial [Geminicoccaceae bacterium]